VLMIENHEEVVATRGITPVCHIVSFFRQR
jgi:hypothetical protein